jgi:bifunctional DNase/RNase
LALPACDAWIVQVPTATSVTVAPDTVQTVEVVEAKLTARPDDAVALTVKGAVPIA